MEKNYKIAYRLYKLGDEYHYLFECTFSEEQRRMFLPIGLPCQPNTVIDEKVMNGKDISVFFSVLCNSRGEHPGW